MIDANTPWRPLSGRRIVITGLLNRRSIAWGIASACAAQGAELALVCEHEAIRDRLQPLAAELGAQHLLCCDVRSDAQIEQLAHSLADRWGRIDGIVHSLAFTPLATLGGDLMDHVDREAFHLTNDISAYSLVALAKAARPWLSPDASLVTLSFLAAERAAPGYNLMGIAKAALEAAVRGLALSLGRQGVRVNAVSAGPVRTAASLAVRHFEASLRLVAQEAPLGRNVSIDEVGQVAAFLLSRAASAITGEVVHVDCGFRSVLAGLSSVGVDHRTSGAAHDSSSWE